jgi:hypothetical protein
VAITNGYATLAELQEALGDITGHTADLERAIEASSRAIDKHTGRRHGFWQDSAVVDRYYTANTTRRVDTDDISTSTGLVVATDEDDSGSWETTWVLDTDFRLEPKNAAADSEPWTRLVARDRLFPRYDKAVKVTAKFGWAAVPTYISEACIIQASRLFKRPDSPFGVAGSPEVGVLRLLSRLDPDVELLVADDRKPMVG